jgi:hypothetical protein
LLGKIIAERAYEGVFSLTKNRILTKDIPCNVHYTPPSTESKEKPKDERFIPIAKSIVEEAKKVIPF